MSEDKKHIFLVDSAQTTPFKSNGARGRTPKYPIRDRFSHGAYIKQRLENAWVQAKQEQIPRTAVAVPTRQ